ncbi:putative protein S-acyltransferase [Dioscorea sansibarensis]
MLCFQNGELRFCQKCFRYKPPCAHHCSICDKCILKMDDHRCIWLSNCVGHGNYKILFLVVMYAIDTSLMISFQILLICAVRDVFKNQQQTGEAFKLSLHLQGVRGICTVDKVKVTDLHRHPYDLGVYENFSSVNIRMYTHIHDSPVRKLITLRSSFLRIDPMSGLIYLLLF